MKKICAAALATLATTAALTTGSGSASAATATADIFLYKLPPTASAPCRLGVTNFGPNTVNVNLAPSNTFEKAYYKLVGDVKPGQSTVVTYDFTCGTLASDKVLFILAVGFVPGTSDQATDPNMANNIVAFVYGAPRFGSS